MNDDIELNMQLEGATSQYDEPDRISKNVSKTNPTSGFKGASVGISRHESSGIIKNNDDYSSIKHGSGPEDDEIREEEEEAQERNEDLKDDNEERESEDAKSGDVLGDDNEGVNQSNIEEEDNASRSAGESGETETVPEFNNRRIILQRFTIYNSKSTMYIVGSNAKESLFRILEINKDPNDETNLTIIEDKSYFYTRKDMVDLINGLNESIEGGIHKIAHGYGLLGLIKFTKGYYLSIITKCSQVAIIGGHYIYHIDETKLIPLDIDYQRPNKYTDEEKLLSIFKYLDLGKTFYFSYAYDITNTLQTNIIRQKKLATELQRNGNTNSSNDNSANPNKSFVDNFGTFDCSERFVWNKLLLNPILENKDIATYEWFQPIIHGFIDQANISIYGNKIYITIIARRSRQFAGARFLKRGVNHGGNVANEIETEQIVTDMLVSSFHDSKYGFYNNPRYTSFVQHRGSIPLYWTQDLNRLPKPPIEINLSDPFYLSSALHFNNLFQRYGLPIIILNLIKTKEKTPRELKLNKHFIDCVKYLNQFLPDAHKIEFNSFDMSKHSKKNLDVIGPLQEIAGESILKIGFFHNGTNIESTKIQKGVIRTNCIDCLDRTNAAQFIICKEALSHQLASLGLIAKPTSLAYDSDLINILTEIFHDHGDTIAIQYGGSNLVNTMDSYRRINQWSSHTRDVLNSIKRIYSNSFMDLIRQEAINLFLGNYIYDPKKPKLWELQNDFYLHNNIPMDNIRTKLSYIHWYNDRYLDSQRNSLTKTIKPDGIENDFRPFIHERLEPYPDFNDNWFNECYVPRKYQSLTELFMYNMNSNSRYFPSNISASKRFDYSPFESRKRLIRKDADLAMSDFKYLDVADAQDPSNIASINVEEEDNSDSDLDGDEKGTLEAANSSYNYLNIANTKKIKNLLTSGMEKLGYSKNGDNEEGFESNSKFGRPNLQHSSYSNNDGYEETLWSEMPQTNELDYQMYLTHNDLSSYLASDTETLKFNMTPKPEVERENSNFYRKYADFTGQNAFDPLSTDLYTKFYRSLDSKDITANTNYLGLSEDRTFGIIHDDYFR